MILRLSSSLLSSVLPSWLSSTMPVIRTSNLLGARKATHMPLEKQFSIKTFTLFHTARRLSALLLLMKWQLPSVVILSIFVGGQASAAALQGKYYKGYLGNYCPSGFNLSVRFHDQSNFVTFKMGGQASVVSATVAYFKTGSNELRILWDSWTEYEKNSMLHAFKKACRVSDLTKDADDDEGKFLSKMVLDGESLEVRLFADLSIVIPSPSVRT